MAPDQVVISPGPGTPEDSGISVDLVGAFAGHTPLLGVCMGLQCIGAAYGAQIGYAGEILHGKTSLISHDGEGVFAGLPQEFEAVRYHSLAIEPETLPEELIVTAKSDSGVIMGARHRDLAVEGVQFHPESIMTTVGHDLLRNFLTFTADGDKKFMPGGQVRGGSVRSSPRCGSRAKRSTRSPAWRRSCVSTRCR